MSKFRVRLKLQGLEIEVEGDREHAPEMAQNIGKQLAHVIQPIALIEAPKNGNGATIIDASEAPENVGRAPRRRRAVRTSTTASTGDSAATTWTHDAQRFGTPRQDWKASQKIAWMLHVIEQANGQRQELRPGTIESLFNNKFKSAGLLRRQNIPRDLGNAQDQFGELEGKWFLKDKGHEEAERLVSEATGQTAPANH